MNSCYGKCCLQRNGTVQAELKWCFPWWIERLPSDTLTPGSSLWQHSEVCSHQAFLSLHVRMTGTAKSNRNCLACFEEAFGKLLWSCYLSLPPNLGDMGRGNCSVLPQPDSRHFSNLSFHTRSESSRGILLGIQVSSTRWLSLIENTSGFHFLLNKSFVFCCCFLKALD